MVTFPCNPLQATGAFISCPVVTYFSPLSASEYSELEGTHKGHGVQLCLLFTGTQLFNLQMAHACEFPLSPSSFPCIYVPNFCCLYSFAACR